MKTLVGIILGSIVYRILLGGWMTAWGRDFLGLDASSYLQAVDVLFYGGELRFDYERPPLAPALHLWPFLAVFNDQWGLIVWASLIGTLPSIGIAILARQMGLSHTRVMLLTGFVAFEPFSQHLWFAGAVPMVGTFLTYIALWAIRRGTTRSRVLAVAAISIIPLTNLPIFIGCGLILGAYWLHNRNRRDLITMVLGGLGGALMFLPFSGNASPFTNPEYQTEIGFALIGGSFVTSWAFITTWWWAFAFWIVTLTWARNEWWPAMLFVATTTMTVIIFTNEPLYNIPLRLSGAMMPLAFLAVARYSSTLGARLWLVPASLLIVLSPLVTITWYSGGYAELLPIADELPRDKTIRMNHRTQSYYLEYYLDREVIHSTYPTGVPAGFRDDADNMLCALGQGAFDKCATDDEYWIMRHYYNEFEWWHAENLWYNYKGNNRRDLPCWIEPIQSVVVESTTLSFVLPNRYTVYKVYANHDCNML